MLPATWCGKFSVRPALVENMGAGQPSTLILSCDGGPMYLFEHLLQFSQIGLGSPPIQFHQKSLGLIFVAGIEQTDDVRLDFGQEGVVLQTRQVERRTEVLVSKLGFAQVVHQNRLQEEVVGLALRVECPRYEGMHVERVDQ